MDRSETEARIIGGGPTGVAGARMTRMAILRHRLLGAVRGVVLGTASRVPFTRANSSLWFFGRDGSPLTSELPSTPGALCDAAR